MDAQCGSVLVLGRILFLVFFSWLKDKAPWKLQRPGKGRDPQMHCTPAQILSEGFQLRGGMLGSPCDTAVSFS